MNITSKAIQHPTIRKIFLPIAFGLLTAQLIATVFVYNSNQRIYTAADAIEKAGYLPIPAGKAMVSLNSIAPAIWGGLFFTLSIGTGLTLTAWIACRIWDLLFKRAPWIWVCYGVIWAGLLVWINHNGLALFPSLFCLCVPPATGWITIRGMGKVSRPNAKWWFVPVITLALLTALWATQLSKEIFITIRDHILLSNPIGRSVNDFYYRYTLYAAESFKSFDQKTLRTCKMEGFKEGGRSEQLINRLAQRDVLVLPAIRKPDIVLTSSNGHLRLASTGGRSIDTTVERFLAKPNTWLQKFSKTSDRAGPFRRITLLGLLLGFPILLFILIYGLFSVTFGLVVKENLVVLFASALCLIIGITLFVPMLNASPAQITQDGLGNALASDQWPHRVAALRFSENRNIDIARHPSYLKLLASPMVVERYWLARALAKSRTASTYPHLLELLKDPHPNVICQAFYALGERGRRGAIHTINHKISDLDHWYAQWYGYRALRKLGWHQRLSK
ncbi:MAG: HEAT repeat domain-containing protein [Desulfobacteraceae bacterium]|jgi:hypothetical protein